MSNHRQQKINNLPVVKPSAETLERWAEIERKMKEVKR